MIDDLLERCPDMRVTAAGLERKFVMDRYRDRVRLPGGPA
jgi:hypothetical protein